MAALAAPLVEGAGLALLRALGVVAVTGTGAAVVNEAAKKKAESAERAKAAPIAQAGSQTTTRDVCAKCPPDCGMLVARNWSMSEVSKAYQARVTGFALGTEWNFKGTDFDGFKSQACLLMEAKAKYDQFFDSTAKPKFFFRISGAPKIELQARRQSSIVASSPPSRLHWHFMQPLSHSYFSKRFAVQFLPIATMFTP